jgi:hypothetical protein
MTHVSCSEVTCTAVASPVAVDISAPDALCCHGQHLCCCGQLGATAAAAQPVQTLQQLKQQPQPLSWAGAHQQQLARGGLVCQHTAARSSSISSSWVRACTDFRAGMLLVPANTMLMLHTRTQYHKPYLHLAPSAAPSPHMGWVTAEVHTCKGRLWLTQ